MLSSHLARSGSIIVTSDDIYTRRETLGSVSDQSLRESRSTGSKFDRQAKFLFCTDGSHAAALAFCVLVKMLRRPTDIVDVVMISTTDGSSEQITIEHYREFMLENKVCVCADVCGGQLQSRCSDAGPLL